MLPAAVAPDRFRCARDVKRRSSVQRVVLVRRRIAAVLLVV